MQLQAVLHDGNSSTFHFVNRNGQQAQIADRDKVKELLQQLLPNFKRKVDKELEEKNRILSENPHLLQLYKDLVITKVLTSEEFWGTHAKSYTENKNAKKQEIGMNILIDFSICLLSLFIFEMRKKSYINQYYGMARTVGRKPEPIYFHFSFIYFIVYFNGGLPRNFQIFG